MVSEHNMKHVIRVIWQMNFEFLKQCVESRPLHPIQHHWLDSIVSRIPPKLKDSPEFIKLLQELCTEVSDDFHNVLVKHTGKGYFLFICSLLPGKQWFMYFFLPSKVETVLQNPDMDGISENQTAKGPK